MPGLKELKNWILNLEQYLGNYGRILHNMVMFFWQKKKKKEKQTHLSTNTYFPQPASGTRRISNFSGLNVNNLL